MNVRDRIVNVRKVRASELRPHPRNWTVHPDSQLAVLRGLMAQLGYLTPIITRELEDGSLQVIDGHGRAEVLGDAEVTVIVTDLSQEEARMALATVNPVAGLAERDQAVLDDLLAGIEMESDAVNEMLDRMLSKEARLEDELPDDQPPPQDKWLIVIEAGTESEQVRLLERFQGEGLNCRALIS